MSDSGQETHLLPPITPPVRKKAPFFLLPEPPIRPSDPSFAAQSPPKSPLFGPFLRPFFRTTCPYSSPSSLVTRHSLVVSHQPFLNHSIARSLNSSPFRIHNSLFSISSITQFFPLPPLFFRLVFSPRKLHTPSPDDGVVNAPPSSRVTRLRIARTPRSV